MSIRVATALLLALAASPALAQRDQVHTIPEFRFENGATMAGMRVGFNTHGTLNAARSNAILVTHGTGGNRTSLDPYIGAGRAFDPAKYFVITVDAIGGGLSSQPKDSLGPEFPAYMVRDMVRAQHHLVTQHLGITRLHAVGGSSMGAFQALEWGVTYPDLAKGLVLLVPAASANATFKLIVQGMEAAITLDPAWQGGRYTQNPVGGLRAAALLYAPWVQAETRFQLFRGDELKTYAEAAIRNTQAWDANGFLWRYRASAGHDVAAPYGGNLQAALSRVTAQALVLPGSTDRLLPAEGAREIARLIPRATYVEIPSINGHQAASGARDGSPEGAFVFPAIARFLDAL
jgi:homoserine O-acetyltransferase